MIKPSLFAIFFLLSTPLANAQATSKIKQLLAQCHASKIAQFKAQKAFSAPGSVTCPPGDIVDFPPRCRTDDRTAPVNYEAPDGYRITNASVQETSRTERTGINGFRFDSRTASVGLSCNGHGCDGKGRVWVAVNLNGTIERIPTDADSKQAMDECIDQVLK